MLNINYSAPLLIIEHYYENIIYVYINVLRKPYLNKK